MHHCSWTKTKFKYFSKIYFKKYYIKTFHTLNVLYYVASSSNYKKRMKGRSKSIFTTTYCLLYMIFYTNELLEHCEGLKSFLVYNFKRFSPMKYRRLKIQFNILITWMITIRESLRRHCETALNIYMYVMILDFTEKRSF